MVPSANLDRYVDEDEQKVLNEEFNIQLIEKIDEGSFGVVFKAIDLLDNSVCAVKATQKQMEKYTSIETSILSRFDHPNIVRFRRFCEVSSQKYIVMDYVGNGTLQSLIEERKLENNPFTEDEIRQILYHLMSAIKSIHENNVIHRDVKPENILLGDRKDFSKLCVSDFGLSVKYEDGVPFTTYSQRCGTVFYMAPEILLEKQYSKPVDVWSCGIIMYLLCSMGNHPFKLQGDSKEEQIRKLTNPDYDKVDTSVFKSDLAKDLFFRMVKKESSNRYTTSQVLKHPFISKKAKAIIPMNFEESVEVFSNQKKVADIMKVLIFLQGIKASQIKSRQYTTQIIKATPISSAINPLNYLPLPPKQSTAATARLFPLSLETNSAQHLPTNSLLSSPQTQDSNHNNHSIESSDSGGSSTPDEPSKQYNCSIMAIESSRRLTNNNNNNNNAMTQSTSSLYQSSSTISTNTNRNLRISQQKQAMYLNSRKSLKSSAGNLQKLNKTPPISHHINTSNTRDSLISAVSAASNTPSERASNETQITRTLNKVVSGRELFGRVTFNPSANNNNNNYSQKPPLAYLSTLPAAEPLTSPHLLMPNHLQAAPSPINSFSPHTPNTSQNSKQSFFGASSKYLQSSNNSNGSGSNSNHSYHQQNQFSTATPTLASSPTTTTATTTTGSMSSLKSSFPSTPKIAPEHSSRSNRISIQILPKSTSQSSLKSPNIQGLQSPRKILPIASLYSQSTLVAPAAITALTMPSSSSSLANQSTQAAVQTNTITTTSSSQALTRKSGQSNQTFNIRTIQSPSSHYSRKQACEEQQLKMNEIEDMTATNEGNSQSTMVNSRSTQAFATLAGAAVFAQANSTTATVMTAKIKGKKSISHNDLVNENSVQIEQEKAGSQAQLHQKSQPTLLNSKQAQLHHQRVLVIRETEVPKSAFIYTPPSTAGQQRIPKIHIPLTSPNQNSNHAAELRIKLLPPGSSLTARKELSNYQTKFQ